MKNVLARFGPAIGLVGLAALLAVLTPNFLTPSNLMNVLLQSAINGVLAVGMTFVILTGGIDLSVGSVLALAGVVLGDLMQQGVPAPAAILACLAVGGLCGVLNGLLITRGNLPPFIATLGMMSAARGMALVYSGGKPVTGFHEGFLALSQGPVMIAFMLLVFGLAWVSLKQTIFGRAVYALGGNEEAAWLSGIRTDRIKTGVYALAGLLSGLGAVMLTARLNSANPNAGIMYELDAIAAVVIGGTSLTGGLGGVGGTLVGALIMSVLRNGLNLLEVSADTQQVVIGVVIVVTVLADRMRHQLEQALTRKPKLTAALATLLVLVVMGAAMSYRAQSVLEARDDRPAVGMVLKTLSNPFWVEMEKAANQAARAAGVRLIVQAAERETDVEKQMQIIENLIEKGVQALIIAPAGSREVVSAIRKANDAGIPVLIVDSRADQETLDQMEATVATFIGSDNREGGRLAGDFLASRLDGKGRVVLLEGIAGHESTDARKEGFLSALSSHPEVALAASQTANAEQEKAYNVTQNILQADPDVQGLFACNDVMALGALKAALDMGRDDLVVVGFDASDDARNAVRAGTMAGSVAQYPGEMGRLGVESALKLLGGESLPPYIPTKVEVIDASKL